MIATKERPILFSGPMVRAILEGRKTQTRRIIKPQPPSKDFFLSQSGQDCGFFANEPGDGWRMTGAVGIARGQMGDAWPKNHAWRCPYGKPGDRLWVRETFSTWHHGCQWHDCTREGRSKQSCSNLFYRCTHHFPDDDQRWVPSIFMPRWASRITLQVLDVQVERLNEISEADAMAEGVERIELGPSEINGLAVHPTTSTYVAAFERLWEAINGPGSWSANPWVWVVEFRRLTP